MNPNAKKYFLSYLAQTSDQPMMLEIESAKGSWIYSSDNKKYLDFISGIGVSNIGHGDPDVITAIQKQSNAYLHTMVYGEHIQGPQVQYAKELTDVLGAPFENVYFVNSGSEATEGALKLAKKFTGRENILAFKNSYHGSTHGALSVTGADSLKSGYGPFLPNVSFLELNHFEDLKMINEKTACVIIELIQAEAGIRVADKKFIEELKSACTKSGTLLIFDEIQTGMGRTGTMFLHEQYGVKPDILLLGKALGGGLPLGAFISSKKIMQVLSHDPVLGHITTFGGHPLSCAAGLAAFRKIRNEQLFKRAHSLEIMIREALSSPLVHEVRGKGFLLAAETGLSFEQTLRVAQLCWQEGLLIDWFLHCGSAFRISPPLTISDEELAFGLEILLSSLERTI